MGEMIRARPQTQRQRAQPQDQIVDGPKTCAALQSPRDTEIEALAEALRKNPGLRGPPT